MTSTPVRGLCVWFTGLSGAGKSTTVRAVAQLLTDRGHSSCVLDGDEVRQRVCADLGFSKSDRDTNVRRVAVLARDLVARGQIVLCALVSPYRYARAIARDIVGSHCFIEVFVDTPLSICEARDPKGLYARARSGAITSFTGIDSPYEPPLCPDLVLRTVDVTVSENAHRVVECLEYLVSPVAANDRRAR